jgi:hypothetical protein
MRGPDRIGFASAGHGIVDEGGLQQGFCPFDQVGAFLRGKQLVDDLDAGGRMKSAPAGRRGFDPRPSFAIDLSARSRGSRSLQGYDPDETWTPTSDEMTESDAE